MRKASVALLTAFVLGSGLVENAKEQLSEAGFSGSSELSEQELAAPAVPAGAPQEDVVIRVAGQKDSCYYKTIEGNDCVYRCSSGRVHRQPVSNGPIACPQIVFLF